MKKAIVTALIVTVGLGGLTACGSEDGKTHLPPLNKKISAKEKAEWEAEQAKETKEEVFWRQVSSVVDDLQPDNLQDVTIESVIRSGWLACKQLENGKGEEGAMDAVAKSLDKSLSWQPGEDVLYDIVASAEFGMCPKFDK